MDDQQKNQTLDQIEAFLQEMIEQLAPLQKDPIGRGRPRILPCLCLWAGVVVCVLRGWSSQLAVWRLLSNKGLWNYPRYPISDQAVYKRLETDGYQTLQALFEQVTQVMSQRLEPYTQKLAAFASGVVAIDATTLDQVSRTLPWLRNVPPGDRQLLPGKLAAVFDVRLRQWRQVHYIENPSENDKVAARGLLKWVEKGSLILADMGYFGFAWFDDLTDGGYYWLSRVREKTSYEVLHVYYQQGDTFDGLVWLGAYRADRAKHAVRLVTFRVGNTLHRYMTNVRDPRLLSLPEMAGLYAHRWDIEMAFKLIKRELDLHLFWSAKPAVILQQVYAVLTISQVLLGLQMEIAGKAGVDPFDVSLPLLVEYLPRWYDVDFVALIVESGKDFGFIRPSRRIRIRTPEIDPAVYQPPPQGLTLIREPRYAGRRCEHVSNN